MARYDFGGTLADFVVTSRRLGGLDVLGLASATLTFWSAQSGGTRYTDLQLNGSAATSISVGTDGQVPKFQGPDGVTEMWADGGAPRVRIVTLQGAPGPAGKDGTNGLPGVNAVANDTATASQISTPGSATQAAADARYAGKGLLTVNAADPQFGSVRNQTQIQNAIDYVAGLGGGKVLVLAKDGPWSIGRRAGSVDSKTGGIYITTPNITLESDGATFNLTAGNGFIQARSQLGAQVTVTADTTTADTTLTVTDSSSFTVGQQTFLRLGQAVYDAAEPDYWLYSRVAAVPDSTHVTLDRPVGYAMSVAATPTVAQRSLAPITSFVENVQILGTWNLVNPMTGGANAESGLNFQYARDVTVGTIVGTDCGAGAFGAQFVDGLQVGVVRVKSAIAQNGQASKGRAVSLAETRGANIDVVQASNVERAFVSVEGHCNGVRIGHLIANNNHPTRTNASVGIVNTLGDSRISIGSLQLMGNSSYIWGGSGGGNALLIDELYSYAGTRPVIADLGAVQRKLYVDSTFFQTRRSYRVLIPLTANMSSAVTNLPAGYARETLVHASTLTGITSFKLGSTGNVSPEQVSNLVVGTTSLAQGRGFGGAGGGYNAALNSGKRVLVSTDATVPAGAFIVVQVDYFADPAVNDQDANLAAAYSSTSGSGGGAVATHATTHRVGGTDDLLLIAGQDSATAFEPIPWYAAGGRPSNVNGTVHLTYFTANGAVSLSTVTMSTGSTLAVGATLARLGLYQVAANGDLTLVARSAADATINASGGTQARTFDVTGGFPSTFTTTVGQRYALAWIIVGATTVGNYQGVVLTSGMTNSTPRRAGVITAQTDLPTTATSGTIAADANPIWLRAS